MRVTILDPFSYQEFPETEVMVEISDEDLKKIGVTHEFDMTTFAVIPSKTLRIRAIKRELSRTDYVSHKINEAIARSILSGSQDEVKELITHYSTILEQRENWRKEINQLESELAK